MCPKGHSAKYWHEKGYCKLCRCYATWRWRRGIRAPRYRLRTDKFKELVNWGNRVKMLELAGIADGSYSRYMRGQTCRIVEHRNTLARLLKVTHDELWETI